MGRQPSLYIGQKFGPLTVAQASFTNASGLIYYRADCDCGGSIVLNARDIKRRGSYNTRCACNPSLKWQEQLAFDDANVGKKFGRLTYVKRVARDTDAEYSSGLFRCDCGNEIVVRLASVVNGKQRSCGCSRLSEKYQVNDGNDGFRRLLHDYRYRAKVSGIAWELTDEKAFELFGGDCYLCGKEPAERTRSGVKFVSNGIDRIDGTGPYTVENSASCCGDCNQMKGTMSKDEFIEHLNKMKARMHIWAEKLKGDRV